MDADPAPGNRGRHPGCAGQESDAGRYSVDGDAVYGAGGDCEEMPTCGVGAFGGVMHYNVTRENGEVVNVLAWFGNSEIEGCHNALLLEGGDIVLLKTEQVIRFDEVAKLRSDYQAWYKVFGGGYASDILRAALAHRDNILKKKRQEQSRHK